MCNATLQSDDAGIMHLRRCVAAWTRASLGRPVYPVVAIDVPTCTLHLKSLVSVCAPGIIAVPDTAAGAAVRAQIDQLRSGGDVIGSVAAAADYEWLSR
jgi:hypothetical protein